MILQNPPNATWTQLLDNPYGGQTLGATVLENWTQQTGDGYLMSQITAGNTINNLGNPSIAWSTPFTLPLLYKSITLNIGWAVQNIYYTAADNVSVIARVDGNYVNGAAYFEGTPTTLETDNISGNATSHPVWARSYDITNLIDTGVGANHTLDFGMWMENTNHTNAEAQVLFDYAYITYVQADTFKIGDVGFNLSVSYENYKPGVRTTPSWQTDPLYRSLYLYFYVGSFDRSFGVYSSMGSIYQFLNLTSGGSQSLYFDFNLTSNLLPYMDMPRFTYAFGVVNILDNITNDLFTHIYFTNIQMNLYYGTNNLSNLELQVMNNTLQWTNVTLLINVFNGSFVSNNQVSLQFQSLNSTWNNSIIQYYSQVYLSYNDFMQAFVNVSITSWTSSVTNWNVTFNNLNGLLNLGSYYSWANLVYYNITFDDLPALDGLGNNSQDWLFVQAIAPGFSIWNSTTLITNGTNNLGTSQNVTLVNPFYLGLGLQISGGFTVQFTAPNYLSSTQLVYAPNTPSSEFFKENSSVIVANLTAPKLDPNPLGNYNATIFNATGQIVNNFPQFITNTHGNLTQSWTVSNAQGLGLYTLQTIWNDTQNGRTQRLGVQQSTFYMFNLTTGGLTQGPSSLTSGAVATIVVWFNQTDSSIAYTAGLTNATVNVYNDGTGNLWGTDWAPYQYLYSSSSLTYLGSGNYTFQCTDNQCTSGKLHIENKDNKIILHGSKCLLWIKYHRICNECHLHQRSATDCKLQLLTFFKYSLC